MAEFIALIFGLKTLLREIEAEQKMQTFPIFSLKSHGSFTVHIYFYCFDIAFQFIECEWNA